jgi:hypothetical protein
MHLLQMRLNGLGPFDEIELGFCNEQGEPRLVTVIHGGGGVGKSTVLAALASTRPGNATVISAGLTGEREAPGSVVCEFHLGQDDSERPHALTVASPNARVHVEEDREMLRRREQASFERASREAGFVFVAIPATRWFSRQPLALVAPARNLARYDARAPSTADDPARGDLAREVKQILAYAMVTSALANQRPKERRFEWLSTALAHAVNTLLKLVGYRFVGVDTLSLEPLFQTDSDKEVPFDSLPTRVRNLVAFAALPVRALWAAYPFRDPLQAEGIVTIDEVDLYQDPTLLVHLMPTLNEALPRVQWIVTATSPCVAAGCDVSEVIALRRSPEAGTVEYFTGAMALTH